MASHVDDELKDAVNGVETCLATPLVPGELERWIDAVDQSLANLEPRLRTRIEEAHSDQFGTILREDPNLQARVDQLRENDAANLERLTTLRDRVDVLRRLIPEIEPDEKKVREHVEALVDDGAIFGFRVNQNETAITTWLLEAFDRDRGEVD